MRGLRRLAALAAGLAVLGGCSGQSITRAVTPGIDVAHAALQGGSPQVAIQVADGILKNQPGNIAARCVRGDALTMLGHFAEAEADYRAVPASDAASTCGKLGLGRLRLASDPAQAEALFLDVLNYDPRNTTALNDLGIARDLLGRHTDAQEAYRHALGINPELNSAQVNLALSLAMSGQGDRAQSLIRPMATAPGATRKLRHDYAAVLALSGQRAEAERVLGSDLSPAEMRDFLDKLDPGRATTLLSAPMPAGTAAPMPAAAASPPVTAAGSGVVVQLAALPSEDAAQTEWQRLQETAPTVLAGRQPSIARAERNGHSFWRLRVGGFSDAGSARAFCERLRTAGAACVVGSP